MNPKLPLTSITRQLKEVTNKITCHKTVILVILYCAFLPNKTLLILQKKKKFFCRQFVCTIISFCNFSLKYFLMCFILNEIQGKTTF